MLNMDAFNKKSHIFARRFIWAETSYLSAWWETAPSEQHRDLMRKLIKEGRLEIVTGGWVCFKQYPNVFLLLISAPFIR